MFCPSYARYARAPRPGRPLTSNLDIMGEATADFLRLARPGTFMEGLVTGFVSLPRF